MASNILPSSFEVCQRSILKFRKVSPQELEHTLTSAGREPRKVAPCTLLQRRYTDVKHALSALNVNRR
ncbi:MAG: hypothetical protein P8N63_15550, partial [Pseudomonadales bacterium]|nr:hypothetical protein [Pseudomonadales bacterium]